MSNKHHTKEEEDKKTKKKRMSSTEKEEGGAAHTEKKPKGEEKEQRVDEKRLKGEEKEQKVEEIKVAVEENKEKGVKKNINKPEVEEVRRGEMGEEVKQAFAKAWNQLDYHDGMNSSSPPFPSPLPSLSFSSLSLLSSHAVIHIPLSILLSFCCIRCPSLFHSFPPFSPLII